MDSGDTLADRSLFNDMHAYQDLMKQIQHPDLNDAVSAATKVLHGRPYQFDPCGEGSNGDIDKRPTSTTAAFDCFTFVNTVLAMLAQHDKQDSPSSAYDHLNQLRYLKPTAQYFYRHHFVETTWTEENRKKNHLKGSLLTDTQWAPFRKNLMLTIDYPAWIQHQKESLNSNHNHLQSTAHLQSASHIDQLAIPDIYQEKRQVHIDYIPLDALLEKNNLSRAQPGPAWELLPKCCLVQLICDNWSSSQRHKLGRLKKSPTPLAVAHLGFLHTQNNVRHFSHAKINQCTETTRFIDYLHFLRQEAPHISGVHLEALHYPLTSSGTT